MAIEKKVAAFNQYWDFSQAEKTPKTNGWRGQNGQVVHQWPGTWSEIEKGFRPYMEVGRAPLSVPWVGDRATRVSVLFEVSRFSLMCTSWHHAKHLICVNKMPGSVHKFLQINKSHRCLERYMQRHVHATDGFSSWSEGLHSQVSQTCWLPHVHEMASTRISGWNGLLVTENLTE